MANKKKLALLISLPCLAPALGAAVEVGPIKFSGFADVIYTLADSTVDGGNSEEGRFNTSGEIDLDAALAEDVSVRFDLDLNPAGSGDSARFEQAYVKWGLTPQVFVKGGIFNNRLGWESEDAPDLYQISQGQLYGIWNAETAGQTGNNLAGLEVGFDVNAVTFYGAVLNDLGDVREESSFKIAAEIEALPNLNVVAGLITQDQQAETLFDVHATWRWSRLVLGGEMLFASEVYDFGFGLTANYQVTEWVSGTLRYDFVSYDLDAVDDTSSLTFAALFPLREYLFVNAELRLNQDDNQVPIIGDGTVIAAELLATF